MRQWMLLAFIFLAVFLVVFNFDPVGDGLQKIFGKGADGRAINIILTALIIYSLVRKK